MTMIPVNVYVRDIYSALSFFHISFDCVPMVSFYTHKSICISAVLSILGNSMKMMILQSAHIIDICPFLYFRKTRFRIAHLFQV